MMRWISYPRAMVLAAGILALCAPSKAGAQIPIPNEPAEINACVCLGQASAALAADKDARTQALAAADHQLADFDAQLAAEKPRVDVNNATSVSRYKALLERRDAASGQVGPAQKATAEAVARYNASVDEYNRRCAGRPFNSDLVAQITARPNCPPIR
jgi:hypothetical protein